MLKNKKNYFVDVVIILITYFFIGFLSFFCHLFKELEFSLFICTGYIYILLAVCMYTWIST